MSLASELFERHRGVFARPEFHWPHPKARIRIDLEERGDGDGKGSDRPAAGKARPGSGAEGPGGTEEGAGAVGGGSARGEPERWLAAADGGHLTLKRAGADAEAHLLVRADADALAQHILGQVDLFSGPTSALHFEWSVRAVDVAELTHAKLHQLLVRIASALAVEAQCRPQFRGTLMEQLYLSWRSQREDGGWQPMGNWSLPHYAGVALYDLVRAQRPSRTLEVGVAHGLSTLFLAQALADNGGGHHVAIDPAQQTLFGRCGVRNLVRAGLASYVEVIEEPNYVALPRLLARDGTAFQLAFIDGLHMFDHVLLDFFYCDQLLQVGGHVVFDDSREPAVADALSYIVENRFDSFRRVDQLCSERITVLQKTAPDDRADRHGVMFHRRFAEAIDTVAPVPPPPTSRALNHAVDRAVAALGVALLWPLGLLAAAAIAAADLLGGRGLRAPFARERRVSAGREFDVLRFRTTGVAAVGRLLRRTRLHQLPILLHVLSGKMSLVGLEPIAPGDRLRRQLFARCGIRAGITGLAKLTGARSGDIQYYYESVERGPLSLLALDFSILLRTAASTARRAVGRA